MKLVDFLKFFFHEELILLKCPCKIIDPEIKEGVMNGHLYKDGVYFLKNETVEDLLKNSEYDEYLECNVLPDGTYSNTDKTYGNYIEISIDYKIEG